MMRLDDGRGNVARLQLIKSKVLSVQIKSQSDIGLMDNLESVVRQNFKGHGIHFQMALGNIHQLKKYWIFVDCQISQHTLHGARQGCSTDTLNLRAHYIICVRTPLQ
jgi:hypothetical protein